MNKYFKVVKGPNKGFIGLKDMYAVSDGMCKKGEVILQGLEDSVTVKENACKPAGKDGEKANIDQQIKQNVNQIKDLMNRKKRLDMPELTEVEIKKLLECIELEE